MPGVCDQHRGISTGPEDRTKHSCSTKATSRLISWRATIGATLATVSQVMRLGSLHGDCGILVPCASQQMLTFPARPILTFWPKQKEQPGEGMQAYWTY